MEKFKRTYFERYAWKDPVFPDYTPDPDLEMVIVLPAYKETEITTAVTSLLNCTPVDLPVILMVVINEPENEDPAIRAINQSAYDQLQEMENSHQRLTLLSTFIKLPKKKAGVGLARKIGMDQAARWFYQLNKNGIIVCFDADCTCKKDYLLQISKTYEEKKLNGGVVSYQHPLNEDSGIIEYETYLRYYADALRYAHFPFSFQTLGSCITVRSDIYMKQGGMNTRKAGEDFYFLHKVIPLGRFSEIPDAIVYPSSRVSDRVPFGTGSALAKYNPKRDYEVYHFEIFERVKQFFYSVKSGNRDFSTPVQEFLDSIGFDRELEKVKKNSKSQKSFESQFFQWFDGFKVLKMVHYLRDHHLPSVPISEATNRLNDHLWKIRNFKKMDIKRRLIEIRKWDHANPMSSGF